MPALLRGFVICDGCGKTVTVTTVVNTRHGFELRWDLPFGWELFERQSLIYCSKKCNPHLATIGYADQTGRRKGDETTFDVRTLDKLYELIETSTGGVSADNLLAAIEAVLMAWRKQAVTS